MNDLAKFKLALYEVRRMHDVIENNANLLDKKASVIMSSISIILALFGLYLKDSINEKAISIYGCPLLIMAGLFFLLISLILFSIWPRKYRLVITPTQERIKESLLKQDEKFAIIKLTSYYLDRIEKNNKFNDTKSTIIKIVTFIYGILLILIVILSFLIYGK